MNLMHLLELLVFLAVGFACLFGARSIQRIAIAQYNTNHPRLRFEAIRAWIASDSYIWAIRATGVACVVFVLLMLVRYSR